MVLNSFPKDKLWTLPNSKSSQTTISNLMKMVGSSPNWKKTLGQEEIALCEQFLLFTLCFQKICNSST